MNKTIESLTQWLTTYRLDFTICDDSTFIINHVGKFLIISAEINTDKPILFDQDFALILNERELQLLDADESIEYFAFCFGDNWYYSEDINIKSLNTLAYLGKEKDVNADLPYLGIHGCYDLCNGSRAYEDWITKAKFLNISTLGICEEDTLAGTLAFQNACQDNKIKSIIGETVTVKGEKETYTIKLYVVNQQGWKNLLGVNYMINVHNEDRVIYEEQLFTRTEGLICVLTPTANLSRVCDLYIQAFDKPYFQWDTSQWDSDEKDKSWLLTLKDYINNYSVMLPPVLIQDAYYLEKSHAPIKKDLNAIKGLNFKNQSSDQYFKSFNEIILQSSSLFNEDSEDKFMTLIQLATENVAMFNSIDFKIETGKLHLPQYLKSAEEAAVYTNNVDLFWALIDKGIEEKVVDKGKDVDKYMERVAEEAEVILGANLHDYFLIIWDILNFCKRENIKTGYGRGSAGGSLIAYLLDIVKVDPLEYGLLFTRFLNNGRLYKKKMMDCIIINGDVELDLQEKVVILRNGQQTTTTANNLKMGDRIISIRDKVF